MSWSRQGQNMKNFLDESIKTFIDKNYYFETRYLLNSQVSDIEFKLSCLQKIGRVSKTSFMGKIIGSQFSISHRKNYVTTCPENSLVNYDSPADFLFLTN